MNHFDRYIILRNPISTDAHKALERIQELQALHKDSEIAVVETLPGGREANVQVIKGLAEKLGRRTLLCIAAGDGTVSLIVDILLREPSLSAEVRQTPILPLWCGNANDLAHMLNGRSSRISLKRLLDQGRIVAVRPLKCTLINGDGERSHLAICYASFGASAYAAQELERVMRKKSPMRQAAVTRIGQELVAVSRALLRAPTFGVDDSGKVKKIFERIFLNGSRFAKVTGIPLRLTDERFHRTTVERKSFSAIIFHIAELIHTGSRVKAAGTHDRFTIHDAVWAQFDGEAVYIKERTDVEVVVLKQPFYALSIRLPNDV